MTFGTTSPLRVRGRKWSSDKTFKLLLELSDGHCIECVAMAMPTCMTVCLSTQVGCALGCRFCSTGQSGFIRNLSGSEILRQLGTIAHELEQTAGVRPARVVFMGMGEPLLNEEALNAGLLHLAKAARISWRKILVSTVGIPDALERLGASRMALPAISLHAADQELRNFLMPGVRQWPLQDLLHALERYPLPGRERIVIEYIMLRAVNDDTEHADMLHALLRELRVKINLIPCNPVPGSAFAPSTPQAIDAFAQRLRQHGRSVFVRRSLGSDILASCGQLRGHIGSAMHFDTSATISEVCT